MQEACEILRSLHERIERACARGGRDTSEVTLIGASKTVPAPRLQCFVAAGLTDVGENYVQEGVAKIELLGHSVRWHLIGALQGNKAREAVRRFDLIHSVDRLSLAQAIDKAAAAQGKVQEVLLQVNVGAEASKAGCAPSDLPRLARSCSELEHIAVRGLMCLPPWHEDPEQVRPYFRLLCSAREALREKFPAGTKGVKHDFAHLSMGMSNNFEVAIEEGATLVRIGTSLFGLRTPRAATDRN